jgi:hypothetical protein
MPNAASLLLTSARRTLGLAEGLAADIDASKFGTRPHMNGSAVIANTPAFVFGHLAIYPARIVQLLGGNADAIKVSDAWDAMFKHGAECLDDPACSIYPAKDVLLTAFNTNTHAALDVLEKAADSALLADMPDEGFRARFPLVGDGVNFLLNNHNMLHLGQVSFWRRCMGMGSAM